MSESKQKVVAVSGGFDPVHVGHVRLFKHAKSLGDYLIVILNCDEWLERKKGRQFMNEEERAEVIRSIRYVDHVYIHKSDRDDVAEALRVIRPDIFANGGDRKIDNTPEQDVCQELGIVTVYGVGGEKAQSSSALLAKWVHHES